MGLVLLFALGIFLAVLPGELRRTMVRGFLARRSLVALLFFFTLITLSLVWTSGQRLDAWVFLLFNRHGARPRWLDRLMWGLTQLGNLVLALAIALLAWIQGIRLLTVEILAGLLTLWLVVESIKAVTDRTRPFLILVEARLVGWRERGKSFPSGHTAQVFFLASLLTGFLQLGLPLAAGLYGLAALVGFTRIYVGVHYPRDVLGGAILGTMWGIMSLAVAAYYYGGLG
jgi:membrane-associated phospholipid phosphatase